MDKLLTLLKTDYPFITFKMDSSYCWSPSQQVVTYPESVRPDKVKVWSLLHEVGHAILKHQNYQTDLELLLLETAAWHKAKELAVTYGYPIDDDHIQDCLDTYRDWLDQRSTCPLCGNTGLQHSAREYRCFNCQTSWEVSLSRFCRPYRQLNRGKNKTSPEVKPRAMFR